MEFILNFDYTTLMWIHNNIMSSSLNLAMSFVTALGNGAFIWIVISLALMLIKKHRKVGIILLIALILSAIIGNGILKNLVERIRPFDSYNFGNLLIKRPNGFSFPSGHTASSFAAAFVLIKSNKKWGIAGYILATLIAFSRLYFFVHYPTDVIGGIIVGTLVGILAFHTYNYIANSKDINELL